MKKRGITYISTSDLTHPLHGIF